ncbi:MAG TPA: hypothetical protein VHL79_17960 [Ramlibacter sp.]|jgi:hypothetical protein|nr:hypothetical protein [Ramlibacter sp.]
MQYLIRLTAAGLVALSLTGCTVITVAGAAVGVAATAGSLAVDAAVGTVKVVGGLAGAAVGAVLPSGEKKD